MKEDCNEELPDMNSPTDEKAGYPGMLALDVEKYLPYVENFDITDAQKIELLRTLWNIMSAFVDLGWGVNSVPEFLPGLREFSGAASEAAIDVDREKYAEKFNILAASVRGEDDKSDE